jgi:DNA-binding MarR family transcriptional regulator
MAFRAKARQVRATTPQTGSDRPAVTSSKPRPRRPGDTTIASLTKRPGFLLRRAHQLSVAMFNEAVGALGITTTQYGALVVLRHCEGLDRIDLARKFGLDRTTAALVVRKLEEKALVVRIDDRADRRRKIIVLTARGERMLESLRVPAEAARLRALSVFSPAESKEFLRLLAVLSDTFKDQARAPLQMPTDEPF